MSHFIPSEVIDSGVSGQYHLGPNSRDHTAYMPIALALRNLYTYETIQISTGNRLNWGVKKSFVSIETQEFQLCGIRASGALDQSVGFKEFPIVFWQSNFARFVTLPGRPNHFRLHYQFSLLKHSEEALDPDQLPFVEAMYDQWSLRFGYGPKSKEPSHLDSPAKWRESEHFQAKSREFYTSLYSSEFETDIARLYSLASTEKIMGMVTLDCPIGPQGKIGTPTEGKFHSYLPEEIAADQNYTDLESESIKQVDKSTPKAKLRKIFFDYTGVFDENRKQSDSMEVFPFVDLHTCDPRYYKEIKAAASQLKKHFDKPSGSSRPLNCLILGSPGSGKTYIANRIGNSVSKARLVRTYNLSHASTSSDVDAIFKQIADDEELSKKLSDQGRIYFFDEFDVTIPGTSIIRYLIDYIYEGEFRGRGFGRVAFLFSGGTLESRATLSLLQANASDFDLPRFLFDCHTHNKDPDSGEGLSDELLMLARLDDIKSSTDRAANSLRYLLGLHKLRDFLSRINGFILEIPDFSNPLAVTNDRSLISHDIQSGMIADLSSATKAGKSRRGVELLNFVLDLEKEFGEIFKFDSADWTRRFPYLITGSNAARHVLEFKNMILCDRFKRVIYEVISQRGATLREQVKQQKIYIDKEHVNFLCTVPLIHGARSLAFIVSKLDCDYEGLKPESNTDIYLRLPRKTFQDETFLMHVGECSYGDIRQWWQKMFKSEKRQLAHVGPCWIDDEQIGESNLTFERKDLLH